MVVAVDSGSFLTNYRYDGERRGGLSDLRIVLPTGGLCKMSLKFWKKSPQPFESSGSPVEVPWQRDPRGYFNRLLRLHAAEAGLSGIGGVYVMWHRGVRPQWIYVGATENLGEAIDQARDTKEVLNFEGRGSVYVTWAPIKPEFRNGVASYLRTSLKPEINASFATDNPASDKAPIAVIPPS
jgi:hypothetical protein